jgi:hypothetical protein
MDQAGLRRMTLAQAIIDPEQVLRDEGNGKTAEWLWYISDLKTSARRCRCCNFILNTLNASPWMVHEEEDVITLRSQLVGSKHSGTLTTPRDATATRDNSSTAIVLQSRISSMIGIIGQC